MSISRASFSLRRSSAWISVVVLTGCTASFASGDAEWPPTARKWFDRAEASFRVGDTEDARAAVDNALRVVPNREEARLLSAKIALADLEYDRALASLDDIQTSEASSVRGRAYWYGGQVEKAADELERLLADPEVRDPWAKEIAKLARLGVGRTPFAISGGLVAATDMPRAGTPSLIVPLELNGEPALGLVATGMAEAVIDSSGGARPSWVSLRFGERIEVRDVPALAEDLSGLSKQINAPIKILLGVNVLRHLHPTFDFAGGQFVVRSFDPPTPPAATTVRLSYIRGGGMLMRGALGSDAAQGCSLLVDTTHTFTVALDDGGWKKAGINPATLTPVPGGGQLKHGVLPQLKLGAFDVPRVPGIAGESVIKQREEGLGVELDGLVGSGLLATFRVTLVDGGRTMWLEDLPQEALNQPSLFANQPPALDDPDVDTDAEEAPEAPAKGGKAAPKTKAPAAPKAAPAPAAPAPGPAAPKAAPPAGAKP
ncbi:MAG: hypothetical protein M3020_21075 [Myxococcota bacterium]|nr:hypothetical protein [Myxococcota bacterium]